MPVRGVGVRDASTHAIRWTSVPVVHRVSSSAWADPGNRSDTMRHARVRMMRLMVWTSTNDGTCNEASEVPPLQLPQMNTPTVVTKLLTALRKRVTLVRTVTMSSIFVMVALISPLTRLSSRAAF